MKFFILYLILFASSSLFAANSEKENEHFSITYGHFLNQGPLVIRTFVKNRPTHLLSWTGDNKGQTRVLTLEEYNSLYKDFTQIQKLRKFKMKPTQTCGQKFHLDWDISSLKTMGSVNFCLDSASKVEQLVFFRFIDRSEKALSGKSIIE